MQAWPLPIYVAGAIFLLVGFATVSIIVYLAAWEFVRTARQSYRIAMVLARIDRKRFITLGSWWSRFRYELNATYSALTIGCYSIPRNPNKRTRRASHCRYIGR